MWCWRHIQFGFGRICLCGSQGFLGLGEWASGNGIHLSNTLFISFSSELNVCNFGFCFLRKFPKLSFRPYKTWICLWLSFVSLDVCLIIVHSTWIRDILLLNAWSWDPYYTLFTVRTKLSSGVMHSLCIF